MEYRRLGNSGLQLSALSFGSWVTFGDQMAEETARNLMITAYEAGVNFFDNAEVYADGESEKIMGSILKKTGWGRDTFCVSSKAFWGGDKPTQRGTHRKHLTEACHAAMKRLQVDYLDLFFCHRPDIDTPVEEVVWTMHGLVQQGKILYWGTSEWTARMITEAYEFARANHLVPPTMEQPQYHMLHRERFEAEYAPLYAKYGMGTTTWSPLASGILTGKYSKGIPEGTRFSVSGYEFLRGKLTSPEGQANVRKVDELKTRVADRLGVSVADLAIAWCLKNPHVSTVILGASKASQLEENLKALPVVGKLTPEVMGEIEKILGNKPAGMPDFKA